MQHYYAAKAVLYLHKVNNATDHDDIGIELLKVILYSLSGEEANRGKAYHLYISLYPYGSRLVKRTRRQRLLPTGAHAVSL